MKEQRKQARREFKEAKVPRGIFSFRCVISGRTWIGTSRNLQASHNALLHFLRNGHHHVPELQKEWDAFGETEFDFLVLETVEDDVSSLVLGDLLKERGAYWASSLDAASLP